MIAYVTVGADDIPRAKRFYAAFLPALGYGLKEGPEGLSYALPAEPGQFAVFPDFAPRMERISMLATCVTRRATRSRCFQIIRTNLNETDSPGPGRELPDSALIAPPPHASFTPCAISIP